MQVVGMITRKDVAEANAKLALGRKANLGLTTPSERLTRSSGLPFIPYGAYDPTVGLASHLWPAADGGEGEDGSHAVDQRRCAAMRRSRPGCTCPCRPHSWDVLLRVQVPLRMAGSRWRTSPRPPATGLAAGSCHA